ncbi:MAG TPA: phosphate ABC transporter substrate-binding protein PstS [Gemmatimonadales bacterium]
MNLRSLIALSAGLGLSLAGCSSGEASSGSGAVDLTGAGATFPFPIYSRWFADYSDLRGVKINYGSLGSGAGIRQLSEQTVDFGASDSPMTDKEMAAAKGGDIIHVPTVIGSVVVAYNLPDLQQRLRLTGDALAAIFLGEITRWNDPRLAAINPGVTLPAEDIIVVHRTDGSGTSYIFTDYLTSVSEAWASGPGRGKQVDWPVGLGGKGNEGVAALVKYTPGAIGYTELAYVRHTGLDAALIRNAAGNYVGPDIANTQAAALGAMESLPADTDFRISIVNAPGEQAYPISSLTWLLLYRQQPDSVKGRKLLDFIEWALTEGDEAAASLDYAPLPDAMQARVLERLSGVQLGAS